MLAKFGRHKQALSLTGKPLDPGILNKRKIQKKELDKQRKEGRSFFFHISKQFSDASNHHFGDNPNRRIKTNHLKVRSKTSTVNNDTFSQILNNTTNNLINSVSGSDTDFLNKTTKIDKNNIYGILNRINPQSNVLTYPKEFTEPSKLVKVVGEIRSRKGRSFVRNIKNKMNTDNMTYFVKDKPIFRPATKDKNMMY